LVNHHGKGVVPFPGVLLKFPESVALDYSVKPSLGKPCVQTTLVGSQRFLNLLSNPA